MKNKKIYVGYTSKSPLIRVKEHNEGANQWSRINGPFELKYYEEYHCLSDAINRERFYKMGFGKNIKKIIVDYITSNNIKAMLKYKH